MDDLVALAPAAEGAVFAAPFDEHVFARADE